MNPNSTIAARRLVYWVALLSFVFGTAIGSGLGELRVQEANRAAELGFWRGVYSLCMSWALNNQYSLPVEAARDCGLVVQNGYDLNVTKNHAYSDGFVDPR